MTSPGVIFENLNLQLFWRLSVTNKQTSTLTIDYTVYRLIKIVSCLVFSIVVENPGPDLHQKSTNSKHYSVQGVLKKLFKVQLVNCLLDLT